MKINKAYKFRIYPTLEQQKQINKTLGCTRLIYNYYLNKKQTLYNTNKQNIKINELIKDIPNLYNEFPFLKEIDSMSLRCTLFDLDNAYTKFFKEKKGFPKYKNKNQKNSYRTNMIINNYKDKTYQNIKLDMKNKTLSLPKMKDIKIKGYRKKLEIAGRIINTTISKENNRYYASIVIEEEIPEQTFIPTKIIGIDLGIKDLVITSDKQKYENKRIIEKYEKRIKQKQKRLTKKQIGSNNYKKLKQEIATIYRKIKNTRKYYIHKITKEIVQENDIIVTETLKIKNMIKNHKISKTLTDASLSEIIRQLEYKTKWTNKKLYKIDTYYPSSQICSKCGYQNKNTKNLKIRKWICPECKSELDRDINASENIMFEGLKMYMKELITI